MIERAVVEFQEPTQIHLVLFTSAIDYHSLISQRNRLAASCGRQIRALEVFHELCLTIALGCFSRSLK